MELPVNNNVYGYFICNTNLEKLAAVLQRSISTPDLIVSVTKSRYDDSQTIFLSSQNWEFDSRKFDNHGKYALNGAVAGDKTKVCAVVNEIFTILNRHDYQPVFEVYNDAFDCIAEFSI